MPARPTYISNPKSTTSVTVLFYFIHIVYFNNINHFPIFVMVDKLPVGQLYDWLCASELTLKDMGKCSMYQSTT